MAKHNLSRLDRQVCPCQDTTEFGLADPLVEVKDRSHYERKHEARTSNDRQGMSVSFGNSGPSIPETDDGTEIIRENFPDCNLVCPACGKEWLAIVDIYPADERGERPENTFTDKDWEQVEDALKTHAGLSGDDSTMETLEKVRRSNQNRQA